MRRPAGARSTRWGGRGASRSFRGGRSRPPRGHETCPGLRARGGGPTGRRLLARVLVLGALLFWAEARAAGPFRTGRPVRAVMVGGSIAEHPANFGKFLAHVCSNLEVINRAKSRLRASQVLRRFGTHVLGDAALMAGLRGHRAWIFHVGGLNSIEVPKKTRRFQAELFARAHRAGFSVLSLTLPPWGSDRDRRFKGFEGLHRLRATRLVNRFIMGRWEGARPGEIPDIGVDIYDSPLRDRRAPLRPRAPLIAAWPASRYARRGGGKRAAIAEARTVPRMFMKKRYRGRYHFHPNWRGHRLIARLACARAPADWGCDCARLRHAWSKGGRVRD